MNLKNEDKDRKYYNRNGPVEVELRDDIEKLYKVNDNLH